ncbi:MAG TPA: tetratricopeptide repeat protein [Herpetosiphonaceae bacterium]
MEEIFSFGVWLRRRRKALDLTQAALAQRVGCAAITIRKIEADDLRPSREVAERLAVCLELPAEAHTAFLRAARAEVAVDRLSSPIPPSSVEAPAAPSGVRRTNLPLQLTSFVGRADERAELKPLIAANRLVTLVGVGGSGKTRLALQLADELLDSFADGVWLVELAPLREACFIDQTIAATLGLREDSEQPMRATLCAALRSTQMLLILDNCEHLLDASAALIDELLHHCARLKLLVTSREPLNLLGEQLYSIQPLAIPTAEDRRSLDDLMQVESVRLFCERARAAAPTFTLSAAHAQPVAEICSRLDGLPLAIELAAAHIRHFPPSLLLERLQEPLTLLVGGARNLPARQQTLRTTIDWSYQLLDAEEQRLFARLGVFVGGWTIAAASAVCNESGDRRLSVEAALVALLDKHLVRRIKDEAGEVRFAMLGTLQSYALERLAACGEIEQVRRSFAAYYAGLVAQSEAALAGSEATARIDHLDQEHENLRAALAWAFTDAEPSRLEIALDMCSVLWRFWWLRGYVGEGRHWLDRALAQRYGSSAVRAKIVYGSAILARMQGDLVSATAHLTQSLHLWKDLDDRAGIALALNSLGVVAFNQSDYDRARPFFEEALTLYRELDDTNRVATALNNLGNIAYKQGDLHRATQLYRDGLLLLQDDSTNKRTVALIKTNLGEIARLRAEYLEAARLLHAGATIYLELNDIENILFCLNNLVELAIDLGQGDLAAQALGAADALYKRSGAARSPDQARDYERQVAAVRRQVPHDVFEIARLQGCSATLDQIFTQSMQTIMLESVY